jgi:hypothetical protein
MAGSPLKRQRRQGVRLADGTVIAFPYMPVVADLPPGWRHFSAARKIEHLIGLDRCYQILSWPCAGPAPLLLGENRAARRGSRTTLDPLGLSQARARDVRLPKQRRPAT